MILETKLLSPGHWRHTADGTELCACATDATPGHDSVMLAKTCSVARTALEALRTASLAADNAARAAREARAPK
jgi:hypothetical protein